jgi:glutamate synthase (ferredoxin)
MTGGRVVVLGKVGRNFGAGMSGGVAYVYDPTGILAISGNTEMVTYSPLSDAAEMTEVKTMIEKHLLHTGSAPASIILADWDKLSGHFVRVMPNDYQRMLEAIRSFEEQGLSGEEALMAAFTANNSDASRVSGN